MPDAHALAARGPRLPLIPLAGLLLLAAGGCMISPPGAEEEVSRAEAAGRPYAEDAPPPPELPAAPTWRDALRRAFLVNGDLEAAYHEWRAAANRIGMASAYPNANLQLGYSYMFSSERMKSFDRQTFSLEFDPAMSLVLPGKVEQRGRVALDESRAAGERFRAAKFDLQKRTLSAWAEVAMLRERADLQREQLALAAAALRAASARGSAGAQQEVIRAETAVRTLENALAGTLAAEAGARAMLNGMLGRPPLSPLEARLTPRDPAPPDDQILAASVAQNPELASLAHQAAGRADALELARMRWIPDLSPTAMFTGSVSQALGGMLMLPTAIAEIRGGIREAASMLRASEAMLRQAARDRAATLVATLIALRNTERQAAFLEGTLIPLAERTAAAAERSYAGGMASGKPTMYADLIEARGMVLDARLMLLEARAARESRLAELEALMGVDLETLNDDRTAGPTTGPRGSPAASTEATHEH